MFWKGQDWAVCPHHGVRFVYECVCGNHGEEGSAQAKVGISHGYHWSTVICIGLSLTYEDSGYFTSIIRILIRSNLIRRTLGYQIW